MVWFVWAVRSFVWFVAGLVWFEPVEPVWLVWFERFERFGLQPLRFDPTSAGRCV